MDRVVSRHSLALAPQPAGGGKTQNSLPSGSASTVQQGWSARWVAPREVSSSTSPYTSQWIRFLTVLGSGTGSKIIDSMGIPGTFSIHQYFRPSLRGSTPKTSAHQRAILSGSAESTVSS